MEKRKDYEWRGTPSNGYWSKIKSTGAHKHKLDFFCPNCAKITGTIDDEYLLIFGFCAECHVMCVDEREIPTIDLEKFRKEK